jgi:hypothetical protein
MEVEKKVDEEWKRRAREEKEIPPTEKQTRGQALGSRHFESLVSNLASQAALALGLIPDPQVGQPVVRAEEAQYIIDIMRMLKEKTKGNLTAHEQELLEKTLAELMTIFVKACEGVESTRGPGKTETEGTSSGQARQ